MNCSLFACNDPIIVFLRFMVTVVENQTLHIADGYVRYVGLDHVIASMNIKLVYELVDAIPWNKLLLYEEP